MVEGVSVWRRCGRVTVVMEGGGFGGLRFRLREGVEVRWVPDFGGGWLVVLEAWLWWFGRLGKKRVVWFGGGDED
ncbi:uncharacterized protein G2W53_015340 [Senna tora]|uniref:Uncharacterized protein n=1 Tax=Senna tora TaxID=362788 RepID=A0A834WVF0_9FABA|nr:uncharacterized protein G2W53_015340 [Senna tora]